MAATPRFEADIGADISKFMRRMATVDKKIREVASGAVIDIGADISGFMRRAATVQNTIEEINRNDSTININGDSSNFDRVTRDVDRQTNNLGRRVTEARIGADIGSFESRMVEVARALADADDTVTPQIELNINEFQREILTVEDRMREVARSTADPDVEADIAGFMAQMALVQAQLNTVVQTHDIDIRADTGRASTRLSLLWLQLRAFTARDFVINMRASWANYQAVMGAMATFSRNFSEIAGMVAGGLKIAMSPAIVPVLASVANLLGNLGPMLGVLGGSMFALISSFGAAGIGAAGFAAVAIPSIGKVISSADELKQIEEKLEKATTWKARNKLMKEQSIIMNGMSKAQVSAGEALGEFKEDYSDLVKDMENPVLDVFASGLTAITGVLDLARPMIENVTDTIKGMMDTLNANLEAADVKDFFKFLENSAGPALEAIGGAIGNFTMGLFNMIAAFAPLSTETQNSFLKMSESFRDWSSGLSENKGFQKFTAYVSENMPKIRSIFSDAIKGVIFMFSAFGDSSSDMMTKLAEMMEGFVKWSKALGESQGFQNFIDYVKTNGPVVVDTIGEIVDFIINLGKAAAPMGEKMLGLINGMVDFANGMLEAHPWLGKLAVGAVVVTGALMAITAPILLVNALFGRMIIAIVKAVAKMVWGAAKFVAKWLLIGTKALFHAAKVALAWTISTGVKMVVAIAKMTAAAAIFVAKWLWIGVQALLHAAKVALAWTISTGVSMVVALAKMTASAAIFVAKWLLMGVQALLHAAKVAAAWALSTGAAMVTALAKLVATSAVFVAKWVWMGAQALLAAARMAAAWFIALGPVGWVIATVIALVALIIVYWDEIVAWTKKSWTAVWTWIKDAWEKVKTKTSEATSAMWNTVKEKFNAIVNSVKEKMANAKENISNKWEEIKSAASDKLADLVESVSDFFSDLVEKVREKMEEAVETVSDFIGEMPGKVVSFVDDMVQAGADLVGGVISGIKSKISEGLGVIGGLATSLISRFKKDTDTHSPSRAFADIAKWFAPGIVRGLNSTSGQALDAVSTLSSNLTNAFNPQMAMADMRASAQLDTSVSRADMGVVRKSFAAEIDSGEQKEQAIYVNNEIVGDKIVTVVNRGQAKKSRMTDGFYGK